MMLEAHFNLYINVCSNELQVDLPRKSCAFWNIEDEKWDKNGCTLLEENTTSDVVTCSCSHLTNFALIMGDGSCESSSKFSEFEDYLSKVLGGISIVLLLITQFCKQVIRLETLFYLKK